MREVKKEKRGNCSVGIFPIFERGKTLKRKKKKGERKEWKARILSDLENNPKNDAFQSEHLSFCFILKVFIRKRIQPNQLRLWKLLGSLGNPFYFSWLELYEENCNHVVAVELPEIYEAR